MKFRPVLCLLVSCLLSLAGCHNWPKDSYIEGAESTVQGVGWSSTIKADVIATGTAATKASGLVTPK